MTLLRSLTHTCTQIVSGTYPSKWGLCNETKCMFGAFFSVLFKKCNILKSTVLSFSEMTEMICIFLLLDGVVMSKCMLTDGNWHSTLCGYILKLHLHCPISIILSWLLLYIKAHFRLKVGKYNVGQVNKDLRLLRDLYGLLRYPRTIRTFGTQSQGILEVHRSL